MFFQFGLILKKVCEITKGRFFQKVRFIFQISQRNYSKKSSWVWNSNKLFTDMGRNFKFQAQDSVLEYFLWEIGRFEWKILLSEKKAPLVMSSSWNFLNRTFFSRFYQFSNQNFKKKKYYSLKRKLKIELTKCKGN